MASSLTIFIMKDGTVEFEATNVRTMQFGLVQTLARRLPRFVAELARKEELNDRADQA